MKKAFCFISKTEKKEMLKVSNRVLYFFLPEEFLLFVERINN